ncbi:hypothetical protein [Pseudoclavibacter terrae]|uniref:DUF3168 domain-containing protein n=1 Tax=Pseudoclavibacter terrae TaxID=1530195 RepID=A0A7J5B6P7_9MICO|nr:hypothetical protein [Pseudoclavibacter terrae]KAB1639865.1 hypothetical protein F8O03_06030 [Pseudoclavibacter terrae]
MKPPDVKALILQHLPEVVGAVVVSSRPDNGTNRYVRVLASGGDGRSNRLQQTLQVTLDVYAESTGRAHTLAMDADAWMHALPASALPINRIAGATTPAEYPDPDVGLARYTATYQVVVLCR